MMAKKSHIYVDENVYKLVVAKQLDIVTAIILSEVDYFSRGHGYFKKNELIANELNVSVPTITRSIKKLIDIDLISSLKIPHGRILKPTKKYIDFVSNQNDYTQECLIKMMRVSNQNDETSLIKMITLPNQNDEANILDKNIVKNIDKNKENIYFENSQINELFLEFLKSRKELKAKNTERAVSLLINELNKHSDEEKIKMIENSLMNSWKSVFPIKKGYSQNSQSISSILDGLDING